MKSIRDSSGKGWWSLFLNQDRTSITLGSQGPNTTRWVKHLQADRLEFEKDQWYEIELSYAPRTTYAYNVISPNNVGILKLSPLHRWQKSGLRPGYRAH